MNEALKQESKALTSANVPAKIIKDAIDPYRGNMVGGTFWARLVSLFRKQLKDLGCFDFGKIEPFEVHADHPFHHFLSIQHTIEPDKKNSLLHVNAQYSRHPKFKVKDIDGYKLTIIGIFPDLKKKTAKTVAVESNVIGLTDTVAPLLLQLNIPPKAKHYIIGIRIEGCTRGTVAGMRTATGLCIMDSGAI